MVSREAIQAVVDDIVREFTPLQVILFGSYAYGTPTEDLSASSHPFRIETSNYLSRLRQI